MKAFHISFTFDQPQPGVITIPALNADEARDKLLKMLESFANVKVHNVVDLEDIPFLQKMFDNQMENARDTAIIIDGEFEEVDEELEGYENNVIEFPNDKKPN